MSNWQFCGGFCVFCAVLEDVCEKQQQGVNCYGGEGYFVPFVVFFESWIQMLEFVVVVFEAVVAVRIEADFYVEVSCDGD